jgi:predicted transcriptional regulator
VLRAADLTKNETTLPPMLFSQRQARVPALGALELTMLKLLWASATALDARTVHAALAPRRLTLSTVQATLERLQRKSLLTRTKVGRAYFYAAAVTRENLIGSLIRDVASRISEGELEPVISGFVDLVGKADPELLERLQASAAARRKEPK